MAKPRDPDRPAQMRALLAQHAESGTSLAALARQHGIPVRIAYYWSRKLRAANPAPSPASEFAPVRILPDPPAQSATIEIELRSGHRIRLDRGYDLSEVTRLVRALEAC